MPSPEKTLELPDGKPRENCAVVGVIDLTGNGAIHRGVAMLNALEHRGRDTSGIATINHGFHTYKAMGRASEIFTEKLIKEENLEGPIVMGHGRYKIQGINTLVFAQPIIVTNNERTLALGQNGNVKKKETLEQKLIPYNVSAYPAFDSSLLANSIIWSLGKSWIEKIQNGLQGVEGSYSLIIATDDHHLIAVRDPWANRPLSMARIENGYAFASESVAFPIVKGKDWYELKPGEIIDISKEGVFKSSLLEEAREARCVFENIYFAYETSILNGETVSRFRQRLGKNLAENHKGPGEVVTAVPKSSVVAANEYAFQTGKRLENLIIKKDTTVGRSFMAGEMGERAKKVEAKFNLSPDGRGKSADIIEDSVICGTTIDILSTNLEKEVGMAEMHVISTAPKVIEDCDWGVNMRDKDGEFVALDPKTGRSRTEQEIAAQLGISSISYTKLEELQMVIEQGGNSPEDYCFKCFGGIGIQPAKLKAIKPSIEQFVLPEKTTVSEADKIAERIAQEVGI